MKVVVTDYTFPSLEIEEAILRGLGHEVVAWKERKPPEELVKLVHDADAVIVQFAAVNAEVVEAMNRARVIVRYGIGVDNVDLVAARKKGIPVCNVPDYCIDEVADQTLAFILGSTRQVVPNTIQVRSGKWGLATPLDGMRTLRDLTVGLVGFGRIGREVAARLAPFKSKILIHDPFLAATEIERAGYQSATLEQILSQSDILSLHCPSTPQTRNLIDGNALAQMRPGAILINVARGDLVDPEALTEALASGRLGGAALDVFAPEPIPAGHPILSRENVILASHIASASVPAVRHLRETVAKIAARALAGETLANVVNGVTA